MRILIQRVTHASVIIDSKIFSRINNGLLIFLGVEDADNEEDIEWLVRKTINLRIFNDEEGIPNVSATDAKAEYLIVSQSTLHASTKKGNRPSYIKAARPEKAKLLYAHFIQALSIAAGKQIETGVFGADMQVSLVNDGPLTIWMDTKNRV